MESAATGTRRRRRAGAADEPSNGRARHRPQSRLLATERKRLANRRGTAATMTAKRRIASPSPWETPVMARCVMVLPAVALACALVVLHRAGELQAGPYAAGVEHCRPWVACDGCDHVVCHAAVAGCVVSSNPAKLPNTASTGGGLLHLDAETGTLRVFALAAWPTQRLLVPSAVHISAAAGDAERPQLWVVNNPSSDEAVVELFNVDAAALELVFVRTMRSPAFGHSLRSIALTPDGRTLYATRWPLAQDGGLVAAAEELLQLPTGELVGCDVASGDCDVVFAHLAMPGGVAVAPSGSHVLVMATLSRGLTVFERRVESDGRRGAAVRYSAFAATDVFCTSLYVDAASGDVTSACFPKHLTHWAHQRGWSAISPAPSHVLRWPALLRDGFSGAVGKPTTVVADPRAAVINGSSAAALDTASGRVIVGSSTARRLAVCQLRRHHGT